MYLRRMGPMQQVARTFRVHQIFSQLYGECADIDRSSSAVSCIGCPDKSAALLLLCLHGL